MKDIRVLQQRQSLPLEAKVIFTLDRIRKWIDHYDGDVYIAFSGGKDSTVLLDLVRQVKKDVPAVFFNTGLEYPEIVSFATSLDNVEVIRPKMTFKAVLERYGYPYPSKRVAQYIHEVQSAKDKNSRTMKLRLTGVKSNGEVCKLGMIPIKYQHLCFGPYRFSAQCCKIMKKNPAYQYEKTTGRKPFLGMTAGESFLRTTQYLQHGCNAFNLKRPVSWPMAIWTEQDVLEYIYTRNLSYSPIYGDIYKGDDGLFHNTGYPRTGCMFCMFGVHLEPRPNRFQRMAVTHPKLWDYCINQLGIGEVMEYLNLPYGKDDAVKPLFE
jgi:3'-phosphoadenosine 5'-phosphosulfate sulfotransferase (PAPS reductase)/FAD synthetase